VITAPGDPAAQVNWDLSSSGTDIVPIGLDTLGGIVYTLNQRGVFSVSADPDMKSAVKSEDLADVTSQDILTMERSECSMKNGSMQMKPDTRGTFFRGGTTMNIGTRKD
jgi:hypothetical protein